MDSTPPPYKPRTKPHLQETLSPLPLHDLLLLSPSPLRRSAKARLNMPDDAARRRCKPASPRNARRSRRRSDLDDKDSPGLADEVVAAKPRKRRQSVARCGKKDKLGLVLCASSSSLPTMDEEETRDSLDRVGQVLSDLVMWRDVAKSSLWFGLGSLFFFSSFFTHGVVTFSFFSVLSKMGFLFLGVSFFSNSLCQRKGTEQNREHGVKEEDVLRIAKAVLPLTNLAMSKTRGLLFSGDPSTTLRVAPLLLLGSEYGQVITLWRLCALGFFFAFTVPKVYSFYSDQIRQKGEQLGWRAFEAWGGCPHKKVVAASAVTAFWNLSTTKTRIFAAFMCLVLIRYCREHIAQELEEQEQEQALVLVDPDSHTKN